jgi:glycosyltransferase involved in cell wall biosynthesis
MRVGLVLEQTLAPVPGGTGRYSALLAAAIARAAEPGDRVESVTAWHRDVSAAVVPGIRGPRRLALPRRALSEAWSHGFGPSMRVDVLHAPTLLIPPHRRRTALVATIHDAVPWTHPETLTARGVRWHRAMADRAARDAAAVVVPTRAVADQLAVVLPQLDRARVHVIGQAALASLATPAPGAGRGLSLPPRYLLSLATLEPRKGLDVLLRAMAEPTAPALPLLVVGQPGWGGVDVADRAARLGLGDRVRVLGRLPDSDLAVVLAGATALVMPSLAEGFGLPVLEAMSAGVPAITSDDPALVEVGGGATVVAARSDVAALARALAEVAEDAQLRSDLARRGRARAADFDWDDCAARLWALYRGIGPSRS